MVPAYVPGPPQQSVRAGWSYDSGPVTAPLSQRPDYAMMFNWDNWYYFGQTRFPVSPEQYRGQAAGPLIKPTNYREW